MMVAINKLGMTCNTRNTCTNLTYIRISWPSKIIAEKVNIMKTAPKTMSK